MISSSYHETVFKSLQDIKTQRPIIAVMTLPHRIASIEAMVAAIGFKVIFPEFSVEAIKNIKNICKAVVLDSIAFTSDQDTKFLEVFPKGFLAQYCVVNICEDADIQKIYNYQNFKNIIKNSPPLCIAGYHVPEKQLQETIKKASSSLLSFRKQYNPVTLKLELYHDVILSSNQDAVTITGLDNINHALNCSSLLYAVIGAAMLTIHQDNMPVCALGASMLVRSASRRAMSVTNGPGSFVPVFIDSLFHLKRDYVYQVQIQEGNFSTVHTQSGYFKTPA